MHAATVPAGGRGSRSSSRIYRRAITGPHFRYSRCKGIFGVQFFREGQYDLVQKMIVPMLRRPSFVEKITIRINPIMNGGGMCITQIGSL